VTEMDSVTQQNASLVEEVSAAASALERQTEELQASVAKFRLSESSPVSQASGAPVKPALRRPVRSATAAVQSKPASADEWVSF
jgi:methyl-accepting chemotaxis protein